MIPLALPAVDSLARSPESLIVTLGTAGRAKQAISTKNHGLFCAEGVSLAGLFRRWNDTELSKGIPSGDVHPFHEQVAEHPDLRDCGRDGQEIVDVRAKVRNQERREHVHQVGDAPYDQ